MRQCCSQSGSDSKFLSCTAGFNLPYFCICWFIYVRLGYTLAERLVSTYERKGYTREWINQRLQAISARKDLEQRLGRPVITSRNAIQLNHVVIKWLKRALQLWMINRIKTDQTNNDQLPLFDVFSSNIE